MTTVLKNYIGLAICFFGAAIFTARCTSSTPTATTYTPLPPNTTISTPVLTLQPSSSGAATISPVSPTAITVTAMTSTPSAANILEQKWRVTSFIFDGKPISLLTQTPLTIDFKTGNIAGSAGCNRYSGKYNVAADNKISVGNLIWTRMFCSDEVDQLETKYLAALSRVTNFVIVSKQLTLKSNDEAVILSLSVSE